MTEPGLELRRSVAFFSGDDQERLMVKAVIRDVDLGPDRDGGGADELSPSDFELRSAETYALRNSA